MCFKCARSLYMTTRVLKPCRPIGSPERTIWCHVNRVVINGLQDASTAPSAADNGLCKMRVEIYGYACEEHKVTTQDGYILGVQRIPVGRSGVSTGDRPPVLLQHGVLMDGMTWVLNDPDESLAYMLADHGFDVWITNTRGTRYSREHTTLSVDDAPYWDWSWDELVSFELPAVFRYVHNQTGKKLHYVAHSLGTLIALASFSQEKLLDTIQSAALLSPVAYLSQLSSPIARYAAEDFLAQEDYWLELDEFYPKGLPVLKLLRVLCKKPDVDCFDLMTTFMGENCCLNHTNIPIFLENEPQSTSTKNMVHLAQMIGKGTITMYNYENDDINVEHYGQIQPPVYNMSHIPNDFPLYVTYGGQDALADPDDVKILLNDLRDHDKDKVVVHYEELYAHADFIMGMNANQVIYNPLIKFFRKNQ